MSSARKCTAEVAPGHPTAPRITRGTRGATRSRTPRFCGRWPADPRRRLARPFDARQPIGYTDDAYPRSPGRCARQGVDDGLPGRSAASMRSRVTTNYISRLRHLLDMVRRLEPARDSPAIERELADLEQD